MLFHSPAIFDAVRHLARSLATFHGLFNRDVTRARAYWKRELQREVATTLAAVVREVERLLKKI
jgi:hypothetical protein